MSFLDNLENNLKALESRDEGGLGESTRRDRQRELAIAAAPWAERLKSEPFAQNLMQQATLVGRPHRIKVNLMWMGTTLRLEARGHKLEMRPGPKGVTAVFLNRSEEIRQQPVDLSGDPRKLAADWMAGPIEQKRIDDEQAALVSFDDAETEA
jgi:hypothetical protein